MTVDKDLIRKIVEIRRQHLEWICTRHDACSCDGAACIYPCTCAMKRKRLP